MRIVGQERARKVRGRTTVTMIWFVIDMLVCAKHMVTYKFIPGGPAL
jgi:hypothetical protein